MLLSFKVCGGLTNQRISIVQGLMMAYLMNVTVVLPPLNANGEQDPKAGYKERSRKHLVPFGRFFYRDLTVARLQRVGIRVARQDNVFRAIPPANRAATKVNNRNMHFREVQTLGVLAAAAGKTLIAADCAFFSVKVVGHHLRHLFWAIDGALTFSPWIQSAADLAVQQLHAITGGGRHGATDHGFNALHLRNEADWLDHCAQWENKAAGRDNCMTNTDQLPNVLTIENVPTSVPLFIAGGHNGSSLNNARDVAKLWAAGYKLINKDELIPEMLANISYAAGRDLLAAVDYAISGFADTFVGNSVSTFSAFIMLERERRCATSNRPARCRGFHYNGGSIPLRDVLFHGYSPPQSQQRRLKWVFTLTQGASPEFIEAARTAVVSMSQHTRLVPVCIMSSLRDVDINASTPLIRWMQGQGVRIIYHKPAWSRELFNGMRNAQARAHTDKSPLYGHPEKMLGTWLRLDIPILGFTDEYILYTDVDVLFQRDVDLNSFGLPLPSHFTMGTEMTGRRCRLLSSPKASVNVGNAGVMLMNLNGMRRTHQAFIRWVFSARHITSGLYFDKFGPGDQGAFNQFYRGKFVVRMWPSFNWKTYWGYNPQASIIHFHGPKPLDYLCRLTDPQRQEECSTVGGGIKLFSDLFSSCDMPLKNLSQKLVHRKTGRYCDMNSSIVQGTHDVHAFVMEKGNCYRHVTSYLAYRSRIANQECKGILSGQNDKDGRIDKLLPGVLQQWPLLKEWIRSDPGYTRIVSSSGPSLEG